MAKKSFQLDPDSVNIDIFNNHKHDYDKPIRYKPAAEGEIPYTAYDEPSEPRQTSIPI
ncbi:unnamed protein product [marine sediment metagenome]|uniref:Uncharacterized protein n=1 Tax=marine sediment metagenome TaxID=412755 RepID=X1RRC4_9ZZZZ